MSALLRVACTCCALLGLPAGMVYGQRSPSSGAGVDQADVRASRDEPPLPTRAVRVRIRYAQSMGYLSTSPFRGDTVNSCGAFAVDAVAVDGAPGTFGSARSVADAIVREPRMRRTGGSYVCDFTLTGIPTDRPVLIRAEVAGSDPLYRFGAWKGAGRTQPPLGHERALDRGGLQRVALSTRAPRAAVEFEMRYVRSVRRERPR
jgi:hypothetical protein